MDAALILIASLLAVSSVVGLWWRGRQGVEKDSQGASVPVRLVVPGHPLTLIQVSAPMCSYCSAMRSLLSAEAQATDGVAHVEYDVSEIPDVIDALQIRQTPTTLFVEADGRVAHQVGGPLPAATIRELISDSLLDAQKRADGYEI